MGKGGGGSPPPQPTQQTVTQTNLPEYARPYFENLMRRAQAESYRGYQPYEGERVAGFTPGEQAVQQEVAGMQTPGQFGTASGLTTAAGIGSLMGSQYAPGQFVAPETQAAQLATGSFTQPGVTEQFMSPYMQSVVDVQKRQAIEDAQKTQLAQSLGAARQGTYGGARQLLATTERERALGQQLGDIQATGLQSAFGQAQQAFQEEAGRRLQADTMSGQMGLESQRANQQAMLEAQRMAEQSRQFGGQLGLQGLQQAGQAGATLGQLGSTQQQADLARIQAQAVSGAEQRALEQQRLDMAYSDFLRQRDYPMEQLGYFSNILRGLPVQLGSTQTTYAAPPSVASQAGGLGLAGLGLYNMMR